MRSHHKSQWGRFSTNTSSPSAYFSFVKFLALLIERHDVKMFDTLKEALVIIEDCHTHYNQLRSIQYGIGIKALYDSYD